MNTYLTVFRLESLKMEGFMQSLKREVEVMGQLTNCMDAFTTTHTRLVVIVDGLDSCEQEKLLQVCVNRSLYRFSKHIFRQYRMRKICYYKAWLKPCQIVKKTPFGNMLFKDYCADTFTCFILCL